MIAWMSELPGQELVDAGLADLAAGRESAEALLLRMAGTRLRAVGVAVPEQTLSEPAGHRLYAVLSEQYGNGAHGRYNALVARIVSFARAAEHEAHR
jgi:hypothetical protein